MKRLIIWGTGSRAKSALKNFPHHLYDIIAFIDNNPERHGQFHNYDECQRIWDFQRTPNDRLIFTLC